MEGGALDATKDRLVVELRGHAPVAASGISQGESQVQKFAIFPASGSATGPSGRHIEGLLQEVRWKC